MFYLLLKLIYDFVFPEASNSVQDSEGNADTSAPTDTELSSSVESYKDKNQDLLDPQFHYGSFYLRMGAVGML